MPKEKIYKAGSAHIVLSDDYVSAMVAMQSSLLATSSAEVVRRAVMLLEFVHQAKLEFNRVASDTKEKAIEINHPEYFPKTNSRNRFTIEFDKNLNIKISGLIADGVAKDRTAIVRSAIGLMAQFYDAYKNKEKLMADYEGKKTEWHNLPFASDEKEPSKRVPVSPVAALAAF